MAEGSDIKDTVRTVDLCTVTRDGVLLTVTVGADGFLYRMVRNIVGTLIDVALGKLEPADIPRIIEAKDRTAAGRTAPPDRDVNTSAANL
jgi:tRNA pseudouridine38-40 synthase